MKYAGIIYNDFSAAPGVCLSFFTQGCPHHCAGCYNPETWAFDSGRKFTDRTLDTIVKKFGANGVERSLAIMGGEPLCEENLDVTGRVIAAICDHYDTKVYVWTGYLYEELQERAKTNEKLAWILSHIDVLIDGPYLENERDITLPMRGSKNQRIIKLGVL